MMNILGGISALPGEQICGYVSGPGFTASGPDTYPPFKPRLRRGIYHFRRILPSINFLLTFMLKSAKLYAAKSKEGLA